MWRHGYWVRRGGGQIHPSLYKDSYGELNGEYLPQTSFETVFANDIRLGAKIAWNNHFRHSNSKIYHLGSIVDYVKQARSGDFKFPSCDIVTGGFPC